jgi:hypothetical protein
MAFELVNRFPLNELQRSYREGVTSKRSSFPSTCQMGALRRRVSRS